MIRLDRLAVARGHTTVIGDLSATIEGPCWFGVVGANGSGKTTLLRAIAGRLPHLSGQIAVNGEDLSANRAERARRIGFAVEPAILPGELTPREILALADPRPGQWDAAALAPLRKALGIDALLDLRCRTFSSGNLQRVAIYAAFLGLPDIVILDEPFNWLDPVAIADLKDALSALIASHGILLITALHDLATLATRCDDCCLLAGGALVQRLDRAALRAALTDPIAFEREMASHLRARHSATD